MQEIPQLGFGTWPLRGKEAHDSIAVAFEAGFRHLDTAQLYDNESDVGDAVRDSSLKRDEVFVTTKVAPDNLGPERFFNSVRKSLDALRLDRVDLLLIHWPSRDKSLFDGAIDRLVECQTMELASKVGVSNFTPKMLERAAKRAKGKLVTNQVEYHPLIDQRPLEKAARDNDMKLTAYGALARGECLKVPAIQRIADKRGVGAAEVILNWALAQDIYVLTRSNKPAHIRASWNAQKLKLSTDELAEISSLREGNRRFIEPANLVPGWDF